MKKPKISRELAEQEFESYCEANSIDFDESTMKEDELASFSQIKRRFVNACMDGRIVVDGVDLKYTVSNLSKTAGDELTLIPLSGKSFMAMQEQKTANPIQRTHTLLKEMSGKAASYFAGLDVSDWNCLNGVVMLFLSA